MSQWLKLLLTALLVYLAGLLPGCVTPYAMPREFAAVATAMVEQVKDQGVLDKFSSALDANVQNPGLETYIKVTTATGVRLVGVNGEVDLMTAGTGTQLPAGLRQSLIDQLDGPLSDSQRSAILTVLGWNRVESPHNPPPE